MNLRNNLSDLSRQLPNLGIETMDLLDIGRSDEVAWTSQGTPGNKHKPIEDD